MSSHKPLDSRTPEQPEETVFRIIRKFKPDADCPASGTVAFSAAAVRHAEPAEKAVPASAFMQEIPHGLDLGLITSGGDENTAGISRFTAFGMKLPRIGARPGICNGDLIPIQRHIHQHNFDQYIWVNRQFLK